MVRFASCRGTVSKKKLWNVADIPEGVVLPLAEYDPWIWTSRPCRNICQSEIVPRALEFTFQIDRRISHRELVYRTNVETGPNILDEVSVLFRNVGNLPLYSLQMDVKSLAFGIDTHLLP